MAGLTTTQAPFIEQARTRGELFIEQPYHLYSNENHQAWRRLYQSIRPLWDRYAAPVFLHGVETLGLDAECVPRLEKLNRQLVALTGFQARAVSGYVPAYLFFDCLRRREFPTTITVRSLDRLDYIPEPDIFHDVAGHVPMHTDPVFAQVLVRFGECAYTAARMAAEIADPQERIETLTSIYRALARFFWFTVEFGLLRAAGRLTVYGSGLLSSYGELRHAVESAHVQRFPLQLEWAINQAFEIDHYQPLLFTIESFEQLYEMVDRLERWMLQGKLNHVAPGEPQVKREDLASFLSSAVAA